MTDTAHRAACLQLQSFLLLYVADVMYLCFSELRGWLHDRLHAGVMYLCFSELCGWSRDQSRAGVMYLCFSELYGWSRDQSRAGNGH